MRKESVTLTRDLGELGQEVDVQFVVWFHPGTPESGQYGPPEGYDPGSPCEVDIVSAVATVGQNTINVTAMYLDAMPDSVFDALIEACEESAGNEASVRADQLIKEYKEERLAA